MQEIVMVLRIVFRRHTLCSYIRGSISKTDRKQKTIKSRHNLKAERDASLRSTFGNLL